MEGRLGDDPGQSEPTVSPGMQAELREMREVEAELTAFATRQLATFEVRTAD